MNQLEKRVARLEQSIDPATDSCYIMIVHVWAPEGGFRFYMIVDEKAKDPQHQQFYSGPFKSHEHAIECALEDLKTCFPEAHSRLLRQQTTQPDLVKFNGQPFLKSPGRYLGFIHPKQVTAHLTTEEFEKATEHAVWQDPDGVLEQEP